MEFSDFSQSSFYKKNESKATPFPCVSDGPIYRISYIQNEKQSVIEFYATKHFAENKCKDARINIVVLEKFIQLLQLWEVME